MVTVRTYIISSAIFAITRSSAIGMTEAVLVLTTHCLRAVSRIIDTIYVCILNVYLLNKDFLILRYGIVLWGSSSIYNPERVLILQKRALRTMVGLKDRKSCRRTSDKKIPTVVSLFTYEMMLIAVEKGLP